MILTGGFINFTRWLKDHSAQVTVETNELSTSTKRELGELGGEFVYFAIKKEPFTATELEDLDKLKARTAKTKSLKLRQTIFRLWESRGGEGSFDEFYADRMDEILHQVRELI